MLKGLPVVKVLGYLMVLSQLPEVGDVAADGWPLGIEPVQLPLPDRGCGPRTLIERLLFRYVPCQPTGVNGADDAHAMSPLMCAFKRAW